MIKKADSDFDIERGWTLPPDGEAEDSAVDDKSGTVRRPSSIVPEVDQAKPSLPPTLSQMKTRLLGFIIGRSLRPPAQEADEDWNMESGWSSIPAPPREKPSEVHIPSMRVPSIEGMDPVQSFARIDSQVLFPSGHSRGQDDGKISDVVEDVTEDDIKLSNSIIPAENGNDSIFPCSPCIEEEGLEELDSIELISYVPPARENTTRIDAYDDVFGPLNFGPIVPNTNRSEALPEGGIDGIITEADFESVRPPAISHAPAKPKRGLASEAPLKSKAPPKRKFCSVPPSMIADDEIEYLDADVLVPLAPISACVPSQDDSGFEVDSLSPVSRSASIPVAVPATDDLGVDFDSLSPVSQPASIPPSACEDISVDSTDFKVSGFYPTAKITNTHASDLEKAVQKARIETINERHAMQLKIAKDLERSVDQFYSNPVIKFWRWIKRRFDY